MSTLKVNKIESTASTDGGISIDTSGHVQIEGYSLASAGAFSNRNMIINGNMSVHQRGNSWTQRSGWTADRYQMIHNGLDQLQADVSIGNQTESPDGFADCLKIVVSTEEDTLADSEHWGVRYGMEGYDCQRLGYGFANAAQRATLSFYVKTNRTGDFAARLYRTDGQRAFNFTYTITSTDVTNGWKRIEQEIPADTSEPVDADNTVGIEIRWILASGSDYTGGTEHGPGWTDYEAASFAKGHTADCSTINSEWMITGVQFELGTKATPYEYRSYAEELARCQRYFYAHGGTVWSSRYSTSNAMTHIFFPVTMRTDPTVTFTWSGAGGSASSNVLEPNYFRSYRTSDTAYSVLDVELSAEVF